MPASLSTPAFPAPLMREVLAAASTLSTSACGGQRRGPEEALGFTLGKESTCL